MDFSMMHAAGRLIEQRTREQLRVEWQENVDLYNRWSDRVERTVAFCRKAVAWLKGMLETGALHEVHA